MTNNIQKLYELAKVEKKQFSGVIQGDYPMRFHNVGYPPFTDTKQLKLIKWIEQVLDFVDVIQFVYRPDDNVWFLYAFVVEEFAGISTTPYTGTHADFSQALAGLVCELWEDLTDTQKEEVRGILQ